MYRKVARRGQQIASGLEIKLPKFTQIEVELNPGIKLAKLKKLLVKIRNPVFDYAKELRDLREYRKTVDINAENYIESYAKIKCLSIKSDNLVFVQKFLSLRSRKYQSQVEKYLNYPIANQDLF